MAVTNWVGGDSGGTTNWTIAANWDNGVPGSGDDAVIGNVTHDPTIPDGTNPTLGSIQVTTGGQLTAGNNVITLDDVDGSGLAFYLNGTGAFVKGTSTITFTDSSNQYIAINTSNANRTFYNVTVNKSGSGDVYIYQSRDGSSTEPLVITNNLTLTARGLSTANDASSASAYFDLTVGNVVTVNGTLTGNSSTLLFGSLKGTGTFNAPTTTVTIDDRDESTGKAIDVDAMTIATNDFNVTFTSAKNQDLEIGDDKIHDLTINNDTDARINYLAANGSIDGTLTITRGIFNTFNRDLEVDESIQIQADGTLEANANGNKPVKAGAIQIASGGIYNGTSDTTEITSGAYTGTWGFQNSGTYNHNNGTIKITSTESTVHLQSYYFYNITVAMGDSTDVTKFRDGGLPAGTSGEINILGNLIIEEGKFIRDTKGDDLIVHGLVEVQGGAQFGEADESGDNTFNSLVVNRGTFATGTGANNFNGGIRALSAITSDDTITINGTGGLLEGALDDANITLNQSAHWKSANSVSNQQILGASVANLGSQSNYTIMAWVKQDSSQTDSNGTVVMSNDNFHLKINDSGYVNFSVRPGGSYIDITTAGSYGTGWTNADDGWHHICGRWDSGTGGGTLKIFIDGVEWATRASVGSSATTAGTQALKMISKDTANDDQLAGQIMDVKCFNSVVSSDDILALASKINADIDLTSSASDCQVWYKLDDVTETTPQDSSGKGNNGPTNGISTNGSALTKVYDAFSVKVGKDETTTDGNLTITQGKLEGLALTSLDFSGDTQLVSCNSNTFYNGRGAFSVSAWFYHDNSHDGHLLHTIVNARDGGNDGMALSLDSTNDRIRLRIGDGSSDDLYTANSSTTHGKWYHVVASRDASNNTAIYIDGILAVTGSSSKTISIGTGNFGIGGRPSATDADEFSGQIRDVGCWSYALSAAQVGALYTGDYNVTPNHQYKIDEGTGSTVADTGTETAADGTITGATWVNGKLDLDKTVTISTNGTLSAPRGTLEITGDASGDNWLVRSGNGTFTHNNGTVDFIAPTTNASCILNSTMTGDNAFYDLHATTTTWLRIDANIDIHHEAASGYVFWFYGGIVTMGTDDYSSGTDNSNHCIGFSYHYGSSANDAYLYAANELKPFKFNATDGTSYFLTGGGASYMKNTHLKWGVISNNIVMAGNSKTITLEGDMEFTGGIELGAGDKFDANGHRAEIGGIDSSNVASTFDFTDSLIYLTDRYDSYIYRIFNNSTFTTNNSTVVCDMSNAANALGQMQTDENFNNLVVMNDGLNVASHTLSCTGNLVVAPYEGSNNKLYSSDGNSGISVSGNVHIADDSTYDAGDDTVTIGGNFNIGGGLIGRTGLYNNDIYNVQFAHNADQSWDTGASADGSFEGWFRADTFGYEVLARSNGPGKWLLLMNTNDINFHVYDNSNTETVLTVTHGLSVNQWFHVACVADGTTQKMYINGKLVGSRTKGAGIKAATVGWSLGANPGGSAYTFDGHTHNFRVWKEARTAAEIRANMFKTDPTDNNSKLAANINFMTGGTGGTITDAAGNGNGTLYKDDSGHTTTTDQAAWASKGIFTESTSTLIMAGTTQDIVFVSGEWFNNITINAGSTTTIRNVAGGIGGNTNHKGNLITLGDAVFKSSNSETIALRNAGDTIAVGTPATGIAGINKFETVLNTATVLDFPECTIKMLEIGYTGDTVRATGDMTFTSELEIEDGTTFNANGNTITSALVDMQGTGTFQLGTGNLSLSNTNGLTSAAGCTLQAGPGCTIDGDASGQKVTFQSQNNWEVVGNISDLNVTNEELVVAGTVTNCTGDIIQWHHSQDYDQRLDTDTADDRDLKLGGPALDNANALNT